jgi:pimeloyl-ACP methyl ester carboxylesterase
VSSHLEAALPDGRRFSLQEFGHAGDVVLLLPGAGADRMALGLQGRALQGAGYRALSLDYPELGLAPGPLPKDVADLARYAFRALDALGVGACHLLGQSLGSAVAQEMVLQDPSRVASLCLLATWGRQDAYLDLRSRIVALIARQPTAERLAMLPYFMASRPLLLGMGTNDGMTLGLRGSRAVSDQTMTHYLSLARQPDRLERLRELQLPCLVLSGERDLMTPWEYGQEVAAAIPGAQFHLLRGPRSSHLFHYELGEETNREILNFLASVAPAV